MEVRPCYYVLTEQRILYMRVQNPMAEEDFPKDMFLVNKPLYSYKFCNLLENRQNIEADREPDTVSDKEQEAEESEKELFVPNTCVLVVDDNEINRMVAEEMLKPFGIQVDTASDGSCALEMIQHKKYDLIFMDHLMPVMNGIEAVKALSV